jgi:F-type H+-transporting ATPase subunit gamma
MPSLRQYRDRIGSVKNTRKITSAMKMVAASKLKRAQEHAIASQPYATGIAQMIANLAANLAPGARVSPLLSGTGADNVHLLVVMTSDRGLCGGFNANLLRATRAEIKRLEGLGMRVRLLCIGRKSRDSLKRDHADKILDAITVAGGKARLSFADAQRVAQIILGTLNQGGFDVCTLMFNEFKSVLVQKPTAQQLIPFKPAQANDNAGRAAIPYTFEPNEEQILADLLPRNLSMQIFRALLDSAAGEQAARMTAMDNSTRNAGDMIKRLSIVYNRARQAAITKELIEIISGAEAV